MLLFLTIYLLIYGGLNFYVCWRLGRAYELNTAKSALLGGWFILMVLAPVLVRLLEKWGAFSPARVVAYIGFSWMAVAMWLFFILLTVEVGRALLRLLNLLHFSLPVPAWRSACTIAIGLVVVLVLVSTVLNLFLTQETIAISTDKLPPGADPVRIVQISDVHLGLIARHALMQQMSEHIERLQPDLLLCTGDLLDGEGDHLDVFLEPWQNIRPRWGKLAVLGNHEAYAGVDRSRDFLDEAGFLTLRESSVLVDGWLRICGVDDDAVTARGQGAAHVSEERVLQEAEDHEFVILLKHRPDVREESLPHIDLQLSGHTHNGQIFPFSFFVRLVYRYLNGTYNLPHETILHVNRGTGSWGPPMRLFLPREITLILLTPADEINSG